MSNSRVGVPALSSYNQLHARPGVGQFAAGYWPLFELFIRPGSGKFHGVRILELVRAVRAHVVSKCHTYSSSSADLS